MLDMNTYITMGSINTFIIKLAVNETATENVIEQQILGLYKVSTMIKQ